MASTSPRGRTTRPKRPRKKSAGPPRRRLRVTFEGILLGALLLYAGHQTRYLLFEASYFKLQEVEVVGLERLTEKTVLRHSGLELGMPAFRIDPEQVASRVGRNPKVARCRVEQPTPNTLRIALEEKPEVARMVLDGTVYEVGPSGEIMVEAGFDSDTPLLLDAEVEDGPPRQLVERHRNRLKTWLPILRSGPVADFSRMRFGGGGRLDITWRGVRLVVDDPERFRQHVGFLGPVLADALDRRLGFEYIDLRFQDVVARFTPLAPAAPPVSPTFPAAPQVARRAGLPDDLDDFMGAAARAYQGGASDRAGARVDLEGAGEAGQGLRVGEVDPVTHVVSSVREAAALTARAPESPPLVGPSGPPGGGATAGTGTSTGFASREPGILARPGGASRRRLAQAWENP